MGGFEWKIKTFDVYFFDVFKRSLSVRGRSDGQPEGD
jgi:hypothetical protein